MALGLPLDDVQHAQQDDHRASQHHEHGATYSATERRLENDFLPGLLHALGIRLLVLGHLPFSLGIALGILCHLLHEPGIEPCSHGNEFFTSEPRRAKRLLSHAPGDGAGRYRIGGAVGPTTIGNPGHWCWRSS